MTELVDTSPLVEIDPAEYRRLLGYPRDHEITDRAKELIAATQEWYRQRGRPWLYLRPAHRLEVKNEAICIDGAPFTSLRLSAMLHPGGSARCIPGRRERRTGGRRGGTPPLAR
jgi:hypothetical protein